MALPPWSPFCNPLMEIARDGENEDREKRPAAAGDHRSCGGDRRRGTVHFQRHDTAIPICIIRVRGSLGTLRQFRRGLCFTVSLPPNRRTIFAWGSVGIWEEKMCRVLA